MSAPTSLPAAPANIEDLGLYLQDCIASLDNLPSEVLHLLVELRGKEEQAQAARKKIGQQEAGLVALYRTHSYTPPGRHAQREKAFIKEVEEGFEELRRLTDEKIDVSGKITTLIQKHTKKLDADLGGYVEDAEIFPSTIAHGDPSDGRGAVSHRTEGEGRGYTGPRPQKRRRTSIIVQNTVTNEAEVMEEEIMDANGEETRYCFCRGFSYGDMVGCDSGEDCPYEWFHYECVGLKEPPKGEWHCSTCLGRLKKNKKNK